MNPVFANSATFQPGDPDAEIVRKNLSAVFGF